MQERMFTVTQNRPIARDVYELCLKGDTGAISGPGQFVNVKLDGFFLRRPISVCNVQGDELTLIYKVVGEGTRAMQGIQAGTLNLLTGLGNGYDVSRSGDAPLLIGGGVGVPPLYLLARRLCEKGVRVQTILGFNSRQDVFYEDAFRELGDVTVTTADGSYGRKGFVTDVLSEKEYSYFYTCGPLPMLRAVYNMSRGEGEFSFEERMGCGFGACMGCSCRTITGTKRICKDGPVLRKEEILWEG